MDYGEGVKRVGRSYGMRFLDWNEFNPYRENILNNGQDLDRAEARLLEVEDKKYLVIVGVKKIAPEEATIEYQEILGHVVDDDRKSVQPVKSEDMEELRSVLNRREVNGTKTPEKYLSDPIS